MLILYRGHWITLLVDQDFTAELTEARSGEPLPIKVSAHRSEGPHMCLDRARALIDGLSAHLSRPAPQQASGRSTAGESGRERVSASSIGAPVLGQGGL